MTWFHGSTRPRHIWDYATIGHGNDQHGPGWYFTSDFSDALKYAQADRENPDPEYPNGGYVHTCRLLIDSEDCYCNIVPNEEDDWQDRYGERFRQMIDEAPNADSNLSDWAEERDEALNDAFDALMTCNGPFDAVQQIWYDHYRGEEQAWAEQLSKLFDWDAGMPPAFDNGVQHVVVWNPQVIIIDKKTKFEDCLE